MVDLPSSKIVVFYHQKMCFQHPKYPKWPFDHLKIAVLPPKNVVFLSGIAVLPSTSVFSPIKTAVFLSKKCGLPSNIVVLPSKKTCQQTWLI